MSSVSIENMEIIPSINVNEVINEAMKISQVIIKIFVDLLALFSQRTPVVLLIHCSMLKSKQEW